MSNAFIFDVVGADPPGAKAPPPLHEPKDVEEASQDDIRNLIARVASKDDTEAPKSEDEVIRSKSAKKPPKNETAKDLTPIEAFKLLEPPTPTDTSKEALAVVRVFPGGTEKVLPEFQLYL